MLIIGLGNPGKEYEKTRHNVGFMFVDFLADTYKTTFKLEKKHQAMVAEFKINNQKCYLLKPMTYMNLSGIALRSFCDYYKIPANEILIVVDDLALDTGMIRIRKNGSSGGHNGLKSIFSQMGTENISRLRIGINSSKLIDTKDYVLGKFSSEEIKVIDDLKKISLELLNDYLKLDFNQLMNRYNSKK